MNATDTTFVAATRRHLMRLAAVELGEIRGLLWSFLYFYSLLCSYYIIRPMRDEMGIAGGAEKLQWIFTGTLLVMLAAVPIFGWVAKRYPVRQFLPYVYYFFIADLIVFCAVPFGCHPRMREHPDTESQHS